MGINVLSLFDGISCGQVALKRAEIEVDKYYASEIDKYAIKITQKNFPNTIQLGSVVGIKSESLPKIDLLIGGSPCQSFSTLGDGSGFSGKSGLFWEFVRILREVKPKYFLLENIKMRKDYQRIISKELNVEPILINSSLVSGQNRERLYWTNIEGISDIKDKKILLKDILEENQDTVTLCPYVLRRQEMFFKKNNFIPKMFNPYNLSEIKDKSPCLTAQCSSQTKSSTVLISIKDSQFRKLTPIECERLQTLPDDYTYGISDSKRYSAIGNGWTVDVIAHILTKLNDGNDGIPPSPKGKGILPTII